MAWRDIAYAVLRLSNDYRAAAPRDTDKQGDQGARIGRRIRRRIAGRIVGRYLMRRL